MFTGMCAGAGRPLLGMEPMLSESIALLPRSNEKYYSDATSQLAGPKDMDRR